MDRIKRFVIILDQSFNGTFCFSYCIPTSEKNVQMSNLSRMGYLGKVAYKISPPMLQNLLFLRKKCAGRRTR